MKNELFVADGRDHLGLRDFVALLDAEFGHRAADAGPRRLDVGAFDRGEDGLLVGDRLRRDDESVRSERPLGEQRQRSGDDDTDTYRYSSFRHLAHRDYSSCRPQRGCGH